jgi:hypothetical protein
VFALSLYRSGGLAPSALTRYRGGGLAPIALTRYRSGGLAPVALTRYFDHDGVALATTAADGGNSDAAAAAF